MALKKELTPQTTYKFKNANNEATFWKKIASKKNVHIRNGKIMTMVNMQVPRYLFSHIGWYKAYTLM